MTEMQQAGRFDGRTATRSDLPASAGHPSYAAPLGRRSGAPVPLTLRELLDDPGLGLALVAGRAGLEDRGPVRWAHISDTPDPTPWLEGGELLLTTGLGVKDDGAAQRQLVRKLADRDCVGIGFGVGVTLAEVPADMLEEAETCRLPLFTVPLEVPFIAVTRRVARAVFDEHYATLASAVDLHRHVLQSVISGAGIEAVLAATAAHMPDAAFLAYDFSGTILALHAADGAFQDVSDPWGGGGDPADGCLERALWAELAQAHVDRDRVTRPFRGGTVTSAVIRVGDEVEAVLAVFSRDAPREHESLLIQQSLAGVSLELARGQSVREGRRGRVDELLDEAAAGRAGRQMVARVLSRLGFASSVTYRVLCLVRPPSVRERPLCTLVEDVLAAHGRAAVVGRHAGEIFAVVCAEDGQLPTAVAHATIARGWSDITIGMSHEHTDLDAFPIAVREARAAAHAPSTDGAPVRDVATIGIEGVLASVRECLGADSFVVQMLGPLLDHDSTESSDLVATLRAYLRHGCRPGPAADELSIHRHTLAYRLDRIKDLTGRDPRDGTQLLAFTLALELEGTTGARTRRT